MENLIRVSNLSIDFSRDQQTVSLCRNISFEICKGETLGILGESGSGKSLTALSVPGLLPPSISISSGQILFQENHAVDLSKLSLKELQKIRGNRIGFVFQEPMTSLNPVFTCGEQLSEVLLQHYSLSRKEAYLRVLDLFQKVRLPEPERIYRSYPHQLSGGQKQRVMIAMAISCNPDLLIADEPTTALDVTVQKTILQLLRDLQQEMGLAILFITHDISVLSEIASRVLVFYKGEIVEQGSVTTILNNAQHSYTRHLISCRKNRGVSPKTQPGQNEHPILSILGLEVSYSRPMGLFGKKKQNKILHGVSFDVYKGQTLGLVGESGSGKTTIGRAIMHLVPADKGSIFLNGIEQTALTRNQLKVYRKKVQIIFQDPYSSLNPKLTIGQSLCEPLKVHRLYSGEQQRRKRALELLAMVQLLPEHFNRYPHQFSGGQRQRIGIARALALEPEIIILDESVAALDVSIQSQILSLLNELKQALGLTYIFISHDLEVVRHMSDNMVVLCNGEIVEQGNADEIFSHPSHPYTVRLIQSMPGAGHSQIA
jgi:peptide/nickel transport system ATP-binding protein